MSEHKVLDATLKRVESVEFYNNWIYERIKPYIWKRIIEIGSGIGNITKYLTNSELLIATDIEDDYISTLKNNFSDYKNVIVEKYNILDSAEKFYKYKIDTAICLNVLEHIEDDTLALKNIHDLLDTNGRLILLVPALKILYGKLDEMLLHFRRYEKKDLISKITNANFKIEKLFYFNSIGAIGWFINSRILKRKLLSHNQLKFYNYIVPIQKIENIIPIPFGLSLIAIAKKL